jgi:hydroxylysine kinase
MRRISPPFSDATPTDWASREATHPPLSFDEVALAVRHLFGLTGELSVLAVEREQVFALSSPNGNRHVVRVASNTQGELLRMQHAALASIAVTDATLPVPRQVPALGRATAEPFEVWNDHYAVRVLTYLPGQPVFEPRDPTALRNIGYAAARLDAALGRTQTAPGRYPLLWDIMRADRLLEMSSHVSDTQLRRQATRVLERFCSKGLPALRSLPAQIIHNDLNPKNLLFEKQDQSVVTGIVDFGDAIVAPRVVDLAIAIARFTHPTHPRMTSRLLVDGYQTRSPLEPLELALLHGVVCARLAIRIFIWSWRAAVDGVPATAALEESSRMLSVMQSPEARQWWIDGAMPVE